MNKYKNGERDWYNKITDSLYLGAIPLKSSSTTGHQGKLFKVQKSEHKKADSTQYPAKWSMNSASKA